MDVSSFKNFFDSKEGPQRQGQLGDHQTAPALFSASLADLSSTQCPQGLACSAPSEDSVLNHNRCAGLNYKVSSFFLLFGKVLV